ncbi:hypothetical protein ACH4VR_40185 [Streptomyces sp. NPDC020883]|uniref:hypothetical protein n=1 Tax=Streptomyces sp. NPDC020883 TaxID=3365099 RepID=UPI0037B6131F
MGYRGALGRLDREALERLGLSLPAVLEATVPLARSGGGKWHVVVEGRELGPCQHAQRVTAPAQDVVLLEHLADVCSHCVHRVALPDAVWALWLVLGEILAADKRVQELEGAVGARTWLGYARALEAAAHHRDEEVRGLLTPYLDDGECGAQVWRALRAWTAVVERSHGVLADFRAQAPAARAVAAVGAACDAVAADGAVHERSRALGAAVSVGYGYGVLDLWAMVRAAWAMARQQGQGPEGAVDFVVRAVAEQWGRARVRDVTALPGPVLTSALGHCSPAQWADHEFAHQWRVCVHRWCAQLEEALAKAGSAEEEQQLLLVGGWPLTQADDRELAYLAQWPLVGDEVPWRPPYEGGRRLRSAAVLRVPVFAAEQAVAHTRYQRERLVAGPRMERGAESAATEGAARGLLRSVFPYLAEDVALDGARPRASERVRAARAQERAARDGQERLHRVPERPDDARWQWKRDFEEGRWVWVPDDAAAGPAARQLQELAEPYPPYGVLRLHVETGPRPEAALHTLYGRLGGWDVRRRRLEFTPVDAKEPLVVPVHRVVGLSGDRYRRGRDAPPLWEDYSPPPSHLGIR